MTTAAKGPRATRRDHAWIDERSRALHSRIAEKLRARPDLLAVAGDNLARWERLRGPDSALDEWKALLKATPLSDLLRLLTDEGETADRLRQSSPFRGSHGGRTNGRVPAVRDALNGSTRGPGGRSSIQ